jgi:hypothetical protein
MLTAVRDLYTRAATATTTNQVVYTRPIFLNDQRDQQGPMFLGGIRIGAYIQMKMGQIEPTRIGQKNNGGLWSAVRALRRRIVQHVSQFATHNNSNGKKKSNVIYSQEERKKIVSPLGCSTSAYLPLDVGRRGVLRPRSGGEKITRQNQIRNK